MKCQSLQEPLLSWSDQSKKLLNFNKYKQNKTCSSDHMNTSRDRRWRHKRCHSSSSWFDIQTWATTKTFNCSTWSFCLITYSSATSLSLSKKNLSDILEQTSSPSEDHFQIDLLKWNLWVSHIRNISFTIIQKNKVFILNKLSSHTDTWRWSSAERKTNRKVGWRISYQLFIVARMSNR